MRSKAASPSNASTDLRHHGRRRLASILLASLVLLASHAGSAASLALLGLTGPIPDTWQSEEPSSNMRLAQALVPPDAHFIVYYFGAGQGGSAELNIARWQSQFSTPEGAAVEAQVEGFESNGMPVVVAELRGDYARGVGMTANAEKLPDHILRAAIIDTAQGKLFVHLYGPATTVERERAAFDAFVHALKADR